jgi:hypothetical protein
MSHFTPLQSDASNDNFAFVMNVSKLLNATSFEVAEGYQLRRAKSDEVRSIKTFILPLITIPINPWETRIKEGGQLEYVREEDWCYHVIAFQGSNETLNELERAFNLAQLELKIGLTILSNQGLYWNPERTFQQLSFLPNLIFFEVAQSDIDEIVAVHSLLRQHDDEIIEVRRFVDQLLYLEAVPLYSSSRFLGYFAILEGLLTHHPEPTDPYATITRQVRTKVGLLNNRFQKKIDYSGFDGTSDTIWTKMYEYRSALAHGSEPRFEGKLQSLRNPQSALSLLRQTVKLTICQTLKEPRLVADLRRC